MCEINRPTHQNTYLPLELTHTYLYSHTYMMMPTHKPKEHTSHTMHVC